MGVGVLSTCLGVLRRSSVSEINGPIISGIALISLGLFALRIGHHREISKPSNSKPKPVHYPEEYLPPGPHTE